MVARKRTKGRDKTLKDGVDINEGIGNKTDKTNKEGLIENVDKMETDDTSKKIRPKKDRLHNIRKRRKTKAKKRGQKVKLQLLGQEWKKNAETKDNSSTKDGEESNVGAQNIGLNVLNTKYQWSISLAGIPKDWNGDVEEVTKEYKKFNMQAVALSRQSTRTGVHKVLHLFFDNEEGMKEAVLSGPTSLLGETLVLRTNPVRMVYISGVPFDKDDNTVISDLKEGLGSSVYDISVPTNTENGKKLGHAIAYLLDEATYKDLLNGRTLNLWDRVQHCCSKEGFFSRFVLKILSGLEDNRQNVLKELLKNIKKLGFQVSVDESNQMYFLDEASAESIMKSKTSIIFSRSPAVRFVVTNITKEVKKPAIVKLLSGIKTFNLSYKRIRCKATFDVPVQEIEKCHALHQSVFFDRRINVLQCRSKEVKKSKEISRKRFQERIDSGSIVTKPGWRIHVLAQHYLKAKEKKADKKTKKDHKKVRQEDRKVRQEGTKVKVKKLGRRKVLGKKIKKGKSRNRK